MRKTLIAFALIALALVLVAGATAAKPTVSSPTVHPNVVDDGSGGGGGAYPSQTGHCQIDGQFDGDPNTAGPGDMATLGTRQLRCNGNFFYDIVETWFYID